MIFFYGCVDKYFHTESLECKFDREISKEKHFENILHSYGSVLYSSFDHRQNVSVLKLILFEYLY